MGFKDILLHVEGATARSGALEAAVEFARGQGAHLTGLHVLDIPRLPGYVEVEMPRRILEEQYDTFRARARKAEADFRAATAAAGVSAEWRSVEGEAVPVLASESRYVDLVVVGQRHEGRVVDELVLQAGRPVLMLPSSGATGALGRQVMIAWNARRESVRAVHDAMPLLVDAQVVRVVTVNPSTANDTHGAVPTADICHHLARHGVRAEGEEVHADEGAVGETLLGWAADAGTDLIVMGAYGHSRLREVVLGGATAHVLRHARIAVSLSH